MPPGHSVSGGQLASPLLTARGASRLAVGLAAPRASLGRSSHATVQEGQVPLTPAAAPFGLHRVPALCYSTIRLQAPAEPPRRTLCSLQPPGAKDTTCWAGRGLIRSPWTVPTLLAGASCLVHPAPARHGQSLDLVSCWEARGLSPSTGVLWLNGASAQDREGFLPQGC